MRVGILHPGNMGAALARECNADVYWASAGRSQASRQRADAAALQDLKSLRQLTDSMDLLISICPPGASQEVAKQVHDAGFKGLYVDANAVSPATVERIGTLFPRFVDASVIGGPPQQPGETRLYLSGEEAPVVTELFKDSLFEPKQLVGPIGSASALKMVYAGWSKGSTALLLAIRAAAQGLEVEEALEWEWAQDMPYLNDRLTRTGASIGAKAWRFVGEMEEIATALGSVGLPTGFHDAAGEVYERLSDLSGDAEDLGTVVEALTGNHKTP